MPGLGFGPELVKELGTLKLARWSSQVYRVGGAYVLVRPTRRVPPGPAEFAEVRALAIEDAKNVRRKEILGARVAEVRKQLAAGAPLDSVAQAYGGLKDSGPQARAAAFLPYIGNEPRIVTKAFAMKANEVSDTLQTANGVVWIQAEGKATAQGASFERDRGGLGRSCCRSATAIGSSRRRRR